MTVPLLGGPLTSDFLPMFPARTTRGDSLVLHTHCMLPGGDHVAVEVRGFPGSCTVTDAGSAWEGMIGMGLDPDRQAIVTEAMRAALREGCSYSAGEFFVRDVPPAELEAAVLIVANLAQAFAREMLTRHGRATRVRMEERLVAMLEARFGPPAVTRSPTITGASTRSYDLAAKVALGSGRQALFETVTDHPVSISAAFTAFTDIGKEHTSARRVIVVRNLEEWSSRDVALLAECADAIADIGASRTMEQAFKRIAA